MAGDGDEHADRQRLLGRAGAFADLDLDEAARDAAERAVRLLGATQPPSRRLPVVLDPLVTRSLLALIGGALSGEAIVEGPLAVRRPRGRGRSPAPDITLVDDPTLAEAFGAASHDAEGVPTRRLELIADGRLDAFLHNVYTARRGRHRARPGSAVRGGFKSPPGVGARALHLVPGRR